MKTILFSIVWAAVAICAYSHNGQENSINPENYTWEAYCEQMGINSMEASMEQVNSYAKLFGSDVSSFDLLNGNGELGWIVYCHQYRVDFQNPTEEQENYFLDVWTGGEMDAALER